MTHLRTALTRARELISLDRAYLLERAGVPSDPRGIVLGCGFAAAAGVGAVALTEGDPVGWGYLVGAGAGYLYLQTRMVPVFLWLLVAGVGVWATWAGAPAARVEVFFALLLAGVAGFPIPETEYDPQPQPDLKQTSAPAEEPPSLPRIAIYSLGRLQVLVDGQDLTGRILDKRTIGGLWCYLLALAVRSQDGSISRSVLASQLVGGLGRRQQRERLRRQLWDLQHDLGPELGELVIADRSSVRLDISAADVDLVRMRRLCAELRERLESFVDGDLLIEVRQMLDETANHQFLPDFERLATESGVDLVAAKRVVAEVRSQVGFLRTELAQLLAQQRAHSPRSSSAALKGDLA